MKEIDKYNERVAKLTNGDYVMSVVKIYFGDETNPAYRYYSFIRWRVCLK